MHLYSIKAGNNDHVFSLDKVEAIESTIEDYDGANHVLLVHTVSKTFSFPDKGQVIFNDFREAMACA